MDELGIDTLAEEAMKLLPMGLDNLHVILGFQLLSAGPPSRVAGITSYLGAFRQATEAKRLYRPLALKPNMTEWREGVDLIYEELRQDGLRFLEAKKEELCKGLSNEEVIHLSERITIGGMQVLVLIVGALLKLPPQLEPICASVAAIVCKVGVKKFCA